MASPTRGLGGTDPLTNGRRRLPSVVPAAAVDEDDASSEPTRAAAPPTDPDADADAEHTVTPAPPKRTKVIGKGKTQVTAYLPEDLVNDARDAVLALMANPAGHRTLSALIEEGVRREVERLSQTHNKGRPFPARQVQLQPGRPGGR